MYSCVSYPIHSYSCLKQHNASFMRQTFGLLAHAHLFGKSVAGQIQTHVNIQCLLYLAGII